MAEELSYSKAARRLHIAQPALSRAVKDLEEKLGVTLLTRNRRTVALTAAGAVLLGETALLLQRFEEIFRRVRRTAAGEEGEVRVGYIGPPTQPFLGRLVREFSLRHPRVSVALEERTPERVWEMVARGRLDLGLTRPVLGQGAFSLRTTLLRKEPLVAALPANHPLAKAKSLTWKNLEGSPLIVLARREGVGLYDAIFSACQRARFTPRIVSTPSVIGTVLTCVEAGQGVGVIPDSVAPLRAESVVIRPLSPVATVDLVLVWSDASATPAANAFRALATEWVKAGKLWRPQLTD